MKKTIILIIVWIISFIIVLFSTIKNPNSFFVNGTIILGWLLFVIQLTWSLSEKIYINIKKIWFNVKNPDCIWNMQAEYVGDFDNSIFEGINEILFSHSVDYKITELSSTRKLYKIESIIYEIVINRDILRIQVQDLEVSYRRSKKIIQKEVGVLLENLSRVVKEDRTNYYLRIKFKENNPFIGFLVERVNPSDIDIFKVKYGNQNEIVTINKETIELHTESLQSLRSLSEDYLTLSPR